MKYLLDCSSPLPLPPQPRQVSTGWAPDPRVGLEEISVSKTQKREELEKSQGVKETENITDPKGQAQGWKGKTKAKSEMLWE